MSQIRYIRADNASPMTLDGTRTYVIGTKQVALIDPGPHLPTHIDAVAEAVGSGVTAFVLVTHAHPDHDEAAPAMTKRLGAALLEPVDDERIETDAGTLRALATPGHTPDHFSFFAEAQRAVFCGDLMMGGLDTALVAPPEGDLRAYLQSLARIRALEPLVIYPAHGPSINDPQPAIDRYVRHRMDRMAQVVTALERGARSARGLVGRIYGDTIDPRLRVYAESAVEAYLAYLEEEGQVERTGEEWSLL